MGRVGLTEFRILRPASLAKQKTPLRLLQLYFSQKKRNFAYLRENLRLLRCYAFI